MKREATLMKTLVGTVVVLMMVASACGPSTDDPPTPVPDPVPVVDQVVLGGSTLTVEDIRASNNGVKVVVSIENQPGFDPRIVMPWYLEDEEENSYASSYSETSGPQSEKRKEIAVYFPDVPSCAGPLALEAWIRHETWQVSEDAYGTVGFSFIGMQVGDEPRVETMAGLTVKAAAVLADGSLQLDMTLKAISADLWEALRQPILRVVDGDGVEHAPASSRSVTTPVGAGDEPVSTQVHWSYLVHEWCEEMAELDVYYELGGSIAPPQSQAAYFAGLILSCVE